MSGMRRLRSARACAARAPDAGTRTGSRPRSPARRRRPVRRRGVPHRRLVERHDHLALRGDLLAHLLALRARREEHRRDRFQHDAVQVLAHLAADLQHVAEALRWRSGRSSRPCARAPRWWRSSCRAGSGRCRPAATPIRAPDASIALSTAALGIAARGRDLQRAHRLAGAAADDVGEGAADIDADVDRGVRSWACEERPPPGWFDAWIARQGCGRAGCQPPAAMTEPRRVPTITRPAVCPTRGSSRRPPRFTSRTRPRLAARWCWPPA